MANIDNIIEANGLLKRCMTAVFGREDANMVELYKTKMAFDKYVGEGASDLRCAKLLTEFIHRGNSDPSGDTYKEGDSPEDDSTFSAYDVFRSVMGAASKTGDCVGTSQVGYYLLASRGIPVKPLLQKNHVLLEVEINGKWIPIETTSKYGFDYVDEGDLIEGKLDSLDALVSESQGYIWIQKEEYDLAVKDCTKAIILDSKCECAYYNRGIAWDEKKEYDLAIKDFEKYASFSEENMKEVSSEIRSLRSIVSRI